MRKIRAFTLAEVMITMALIGSVAVLTLSNIGANIQMQTRTAEFKTAYSKLDIAVKTVIAEKATSPSCYACPPNDNFKKKYGLQIEGTCSAKTSCEGLENAILKELGVARKCINSSDSSCLPARYEKGTGCFTNYKTGTTYILENGMLLITDGNKSLTQFAMDVNGRKGPNKWGEDIFTFALTAAETQKLGDTYFVSALTVLPPAECLLGESTTRRKRSSKQMLEEIVNKR